MAHIPTVQNGWCNCQAIGNTANYPGPWHPHLDQPEYPCSMQAEDERLRQGQIDNDLDEIGELLAETKPWCLCGWVGEAGADAPSSCPQCGRDEFNYRWTPTDG